MRPFSTAHARARRHAEEEAEPAVHCLGRVLRVHKELLLTDKVVEEKGHATERPNGIETRDEAAERCHNRTEAGHLQPVELKVDGGFPVFIERGIADQTEGNNIPGEPGIFDLSECRENEFVRHV